MWSQVSAHCGVAADAISINIVDKNDSHPNVVSVYLANSVRLNLFFLGGLGNQQKV